MSIYYLDRPDFAPIVLNYPGRPVYSGASLALEAVAEYHVISGGETEDLITVYGTGRFTHATILFGGKFGWADMANIGIEIWIDDSKRAVWSLQQFELFNALALYNKAYYSGSDGWYYPDVLNPVIGTIGGRWNSTDKAFEEYYVYLNFIAEFTDSFIMKGFNKTSSDVTFTVRALVGYYP